MHKKGHLWKQPAIIVSSGDQTTYDEFQSPLPRVFWKAALLCVLQVAATSPNTICVPETGYWRQRKPDIERGVHDHDPFLKG